MPISNPSLPTVPAGLRVGGLALDAAGLAVTARTTAAEASCPVCGHAPTRVHGRHRRTFQDLPWQDRAVTWRAWARRSTGPTHVHGAARPAITDRADEPMSGADRQRGPLLAFVDGFRPRIKD